mmetsp:Transcript_5079/g.12204  ORF Transcript_5079/g.12204 Transcript_5079/m.12204 type:complete len:207 (+) Transcript_5079:140-760(+)
MSALAERPVSVLRMAETMLSRVVATFKAMFRMVVATNFGVAIRCTFCRNDSSTSSSSSPSFLTAPLALLATLVLRADAQEALWSGVEEAVVAEVVFFGLDLKRKCRMPLEGSLLSRSFSKASPVGSSPVSTSFLPNHDLYRLRAPLMSSPPGISILTSSLDIAISCIRYSFSDLVILESSACEYCRPLYWSLSLTAFCTALPAPPF